MERKLTAILSADVKGYSRLMGEDEEATIRTLTAYREMMTTLIQQHGRVVDSPGDNLLAEFASVVDAVCCAVEIQQALKAHNDALSAQRKMEFRIGINLGDVVVEGERIYGDGVNIAARVEGLAEPGGICLSGTVHDQIENKLALSYEYVGEQTVKNIAKPVRVWRVVMDEAAAALAARQAALRQASPVTRGRGPAPRAWVVMAGLALIAVAVVTVRYLSHPPLSTQDSALRTEAAPAALPLPDKPSIAVLPFANMSSDPEQEYFSDGLTEDLITDLSKLSGLFVIARNSTFVYKGKAVAMGEIQRKLGVRYVLEGSVRKAEGQIRITAQLVDATTGYHLWSERYDRALQETFALQDEIRQKIVTALKIKTTKEEQERFQRAPTTNLEAYDYYLRGLEFYLPVTKEANAQARRMFERAIELDPGYAAAHALLGQTYWAEWWAQWSRDPQTVERAFALAQQAVALDDVLPLAHSVLGGSYLWKKQYDQAVTEGERAIALDPNNADSYVQLAGILGSVGRAEEAIEMVKKAMRLNPHYPPLYIFALGLAYHMAWHNEEAIATLKQYIALHPNSIAPYFGLACSYSDLGRYEEARVAAAEILRLSPNFTTEAWKRAQFIKDPAELERHLTNLRKAGLQ